MNTKKLLLFLRSYYPFIIFFILFVFIFRKVFLQGLVPIPSDLLVSFFFPYNSGGWENFRDFITHKEFIASDVVRQIYPWRTLAIDLMKQGQVPLWNPYAFSGTPLLANIQSAVFYPLNIIFFFFTEETAWILYILLQPILAFSFMFLFIRSLKLEKAAAMFSGLAYGFIGYLMIWFELGVVGHTAVWLPLVLWGITKFSEQRQLRYLLTGVFALGISFLAGHAQTAAYVFLITVVYYFFALHSGFRLSAKFYYGSLFLLAFGLAAIQLLPSFELLSLAARNAATSSEVFYRLQLPVQQLVMVFAPDFFGNPATKNFWGVDYNEFLGYFGIVALVFASIAIYHSWREAGVRFFFTVSVIALLFALPTPLSGLLQRLNIPVLGTGIPARALFIVEFSFVVLAAYGVHDYLNKKISSKPIIVLGGIYLFLWGIVYLVPTVIPQLNTVANLSVAKRNLILPTGLFLASTTLLLMSRQRSFLRFIALFLLLGFASFEYQYLFNKYLPFAPMTYLFPNHPLISQLQQVSGEGRIFGYDTARIETNFPTQWRLYSPEGYDPLYIRRYGELMYAGKKGSLQENIPRSDATLTDSLPSQDSYPKQVLMNLLGVRYIADKNDAIFQGSDSTKYPDDRFELLWQKGKWRIYENNKALPRAAVFYDWEIKRSDEAIIKTLFSPAFNYRNKLILTESPGYGQKNASPTPAVFKAYTANTIIIAAVAPSNGVLFLSDALYPGWNAYIDGKKTKIFQADYAFRAVPITRGRHTVVFRYEPLSFFIGALISTVSVMIILILFVVKGKTITR